MSSRKEEIRQQKPVANLRPALYSHRLTDIQETARTCGYAVALHGSMQRDIDVIAVPWVAVATSAEFLVDALCRDLGCTLTAEPPSEKPHGRLAWTLMMGGALFMDLSVMPLHS